MRSPIVQASLLLAFAAFTGCSPSEEGDATESADLTAAEETPFDTVTYEVSWHPRAACCGIKIDRNFLLFESERGDTVRVDFGRREAEAVTKTFVARRYERFTKLSVVTLDKGEYDEGPKAAIPEPLTLTPAMSDRVFALPFDVSVRLRGVQPSLDVDKGNCTGDDPNRLWLRYTASAVASPAILLGGPGEDYTATLSLDEGHYKAKLEVSTEMGRNSLLPVHHAFAMYCPGQKLDTLHGVSLGLVEDDLIVDDRYESAPRDVAVGATVPFPLLPKSKVNFRKFDATLTVLR